MKPKPSTRFDVDYLPASMMSAARWVVWKPVERDGKWTKVPVDPKTRENARSNDPSTWGTFSEALRAADSYDLGLGFMLGDGWLGVDFDGIAADHAIRDPWIAAWAARSRAYVEYSPSGTGIHAIYHGVQLPEWSNNRRGPVEVYDKGRFFCVTGDAAFVDREVGSDLPEVEEVCRQYLARQGSVVPPAPVVADKPVDDSVQDFRVACALAKHGMSVAEIEHVIRGKMLADGREQKAARPDYIGRTVKSAVDHVGAVDRPAPMEISRIGDVLERYREQAPYAIERILRKGEVAAVIAPPKCRKSFLMHDLAISVATGRMWFGKWRCTDGKVLIVDNELNLSTIAFRIRSIVEDMGFPLACLEDRIEVVSLREDDRDVDAVLEGILERKEQPDVVIFDAFYMFVMQGMDENSNSDIASMVRKFRRFASRSGAASVLVHHTSKGSQAGKEAIDVGAGAGALARAVDTYISIRKHADEDTFRVDYNLRSSKEYPPHAIAWQYPRYREVSVEDIEDLDRPGKKKPSDG